MFQHINGKKRPYNNYYVLHFLRNKKEVYTKRNCYMTKALIGC